MKNPALRPPALLLLALSLLPLGGCIVAAVAAAAGAVGYVKYDRNGAYQDFEAEIGEVWKASRAALEDQGFALPGDAATALAEGATEGEIDGEGYHLRVEQQPGDLVRVRVRVGVFETDDHKRRARLVLEEVDERL